MEQNKRLHFLGKGQRRINGRAIAMGAPIYADDMAPENCLVVKLLRCPYPAAEVLRLDTLAAKNLPGVVAVYTYEDIPPENMYAACGGEDILRDRLLLTKHPRYEGDPVALVAAESETAALQALAMLKPEYRKKEIVFDVRTALDNQATVHGDHLDDIVLPRSAHGYGRGSYNAARNLVKEVAYSVGRLEEGMAASDVQLECTTYTGQQAHAMMETHRSFCYIDNQGKYVVVGPFQTAFTTLFAISRAAGINIHNIRIVKSQVGGGFGGKNLLNPELYTAFVTKMTGRPSKMVFTRAECFGASGTRHAAYLTTRLGLQKDGTVLALENSWVCDAGAYAEVTDEIMFTGVHNILPLYPRVEHVQVHQFGLYTNKVTGCAFRGFGAPQATFNFNQAMTAAAAKLGMDIVDFHLKNIGRVGDSHPLMNGYSAENPATLTSTALAWCIETGRERMRWAERKTQKPDDRYYYGLGLGIASHGSGVAQVDRGNAYIRLNYNETVTVFSGHCDVGTGSDTVIAQIAAEVLQIEPACVNMVVGDSELTPFDVGTFGSSNIYVNGNAVRKAASELLQRMKEQALRYLGLPETYAGLTFNQQGFFAPTGECLLTFRDFCSRATSYAEGRENLEASASYACHTSPSPFVATYVAVRVDRWTGKIHLDECLNLVDCGSVLNPNNASVQVHGGCAQGIGFALYEDFQYSGEDHKLYSNNFQKYKIPCQMDIPDIDVLFADCYEPSGPYGAKSIGEIAINAPAPAITNAVFNATGVLINELPLTPEKVLRALRTHEEGACTF